MAVRLSIAFNTTAERWLNQQVRYDLWQAEKRRKSITRLQAGRVVESADYAIERTVLRHANSWRCRVVGQRER
jgi:plasmid maintenance system antidote protein VapI